MSARRWAPLALVLSMTIRFAAPAAADAAATPLAPAATPPKRSPADERAAQRLFDEGTRALQAGRLAHARDLLGQSLRHYPHPATAFNLAVALRGVGETTAAVEQLEKLAGGGYGGLDEPRRREVSRLLTVTRAELGTIIVELREAPRAQLSIDGVDRGDVRVGETKVFVDAGPRLVEAEAAGRVRAGRRIVVERGRTTRVALAPTLALTSALDTGATATPVYRRVWFWTAAVGAVAVVGGLLIARPFRESPTSDPIFGTTEALTSVGRW